MSEERERVEHPSWCDRDACTAPEFRPTNEQYKSGANLGQHASRELRLPGYKTLRVFLAQQIAPWGTATFLVMLSEDGEISFSTEVGAGGAGFELYELLGQEVKDSVREYPTLYAERFPYVQRAIEDEADEATADASMPRDPVELEERMTAEFLEDQEADEAMTYKLTVNAQQRVSGTLQEVRAAVAELVTDRLEKEPDRVAIDAQMVNLAFNSGAVEAALAERGDWYTVFDAYGEEPVRIRITREE